MKGIESPLVKNWSKFKEMKKILNLIAIFSMFLMAEELFAPIPIDIKYNRDVVTLGRELFFDPLLSKDRDISCASCHSIDGYGTDNMPKSVGTDGKIGNMNSLTPFNSIYNLSLFWNDRVKNLKEQMVDGPLINQHEMANSSDEIEKRLQQSNKYKKLFLKAYGEPPSFSLMLEALAEFEATLLTPNAKFDRYLRNEAELSSSEKRGFHLFKSYGCVSCHNGINLGGNSYQKFGAVIDYPSNSTRVDDRFQLTNAQRDRDVFRVPSLRNIEKTFPYFHDGNIHSLKEAIHIMGYTNVGVLLSPDEIDDIENFLKSLTGEIPKTFYKTE